MARLIKVVFINETRTLIYHLTSWTNDTLWHTIISWTHLSISRLPLIHVICFELWLCSLNHLIIDPIKTSFLEACSSLVYFQLTLRPSRFQITLASFGILIEMLLISVNILIGSSNNYWLAHVRILINLPSFVIACWTIGTDHHSILRKLSGLLLEILSTVHRIWVKIIVLLNHRVIWLVSLATTWTHAHRTNEAFTTYGKMIECTWWLTSKIIAKRILISWLSHNILLARSSNRLDSTWWILNIFDTCVIKFRLRLMTIWSRFILRFANFLILLLPLVGVSHAVLLEIIHRFSTLQLLLRILKLLEVTDIWLLHLLLITLYNYVWSISSNENFCRNTWI
jgi:hypothetical protein